jgi:pimeloyl-ACP methyl ester carboxylesterase
MFIYMMIRALFAAALIALSTGCSSSPHARSGSDIQIRGQHVLDGLWAGACAYVGADGGSADLDGQLQAACSTAAHGQAHPSVSAEINASTPIVLPDGALLAREPFIQLKGAATELVVYASDGLAQGGILCYPDDGNRHSAIVHIHGGVEGLFPSPSEDMLRTCIDWAQLHARVAFVPSLRGEDGSEGRIELCLGEANDAAAAAALLRSLEMTDPQRLGIVGASIGGCVALRAASKIPNLRGVVAFVPPMSWQDFMDYHRNRWSPAVETTCDGRTVQWNIGGPTVADTMDQIICGHPHCSDADYDARSPLPQVAAQSAPTLIAAGGLDNVVPDNQPALWSIHREQGGHPVDKYVMGSCDPSFTPRPAMDAFIEVPTGFHTLSLGPVGTGLSFLLELLDQP